MSSTLLVEERHEVAFRPSAFVSHGFVGVLGKEFDGREASDAIFGSQRLVGDSIRVNVCNNAL
jgi:hypothetical protein